MLSLLVASCTEPEPWPNAQRFDKTETAIVYDAPEDAAEKIEAAWSPSAILPISASKVLYAAQGTRKIVELNVQTGKQRVLFDLSSVEDKFTSSDWGSGLYQVKDWLIVATPQEKLVFCNQNTGEIQTVGMRNPSEAVIPAAGIPLKNIDFALFGGIAPSANGMYLALGEQVFHVTWDGNQPKTFMETPLEHIAGTLESLDDTDSHNALSAALSLHDYTHFAQKDGWLFFWSGRLLKAVKDNIILNITGHGYASPSGQLETFYAHALPSNPSLIAHKGILYTPYWDDSSALLRIEVTNIDPRSYEVTGSLYDIFPQSGKLSALATWEDEILSTDSSAGNFWRFIPATLPTENIDTQRFFGPESSETRFESISTDPNSPYEPNALLVPQAMTTFMQGAYHMLYAPTLNRLSLISADMQQQTPIWEGRLTHMASDAHRRAWFSNKNRFYFFELTEDKKIELSHVPQFFRAAPIMGVPCDKAQFRLTHAAQIETSGHDLLLYMPLAYRILHYNSEKDEATFIHEGGWYKPSLNNPKFSRGALQVNMLKHWKADSQMEAVVLQYSGEDYLAIINPHQQTLQFAGQTIPKDSGLVLSGGGIKPIIDGLPFEETDFDHIHAMTITPQNTIVLITENGIFETTSKGTWEAWELCDISTLPHEPETLEIAGNTGRRVLFASVGGQNYACAETPMTFASQSLTTTWTSVPQNHIEPCTHSAKLITKSRAEICLYQSVRSPAAPKCLPLPKDFELTDIACNDTDLYLSGQTVSSEQNKILQVSFESYTAFTDYLGTGAGLPDEALISNIKLGEQLGSMGVDGIPWLHFWMKDTCTIWKLPAFRSAEIDENTPVYRLLTDNRLCTAQAFAIQQIGTMAIVHKNTLYEIHDTDFIPLGHVDGEVIDMIAVGYGFVIMTTKGIYLWERGRLIQRAENPIMLNEKSIDYAKPSNVWPRMTQSPGENAVLVPVFEGDRILKIAL